MIKEHDRVVLKKSIKKGLKTGDVGTVRHVYKKAKHSRWSSDASRGDGSHSDSGRFSDSSGSISNIRYNYESVQNESPN